ncbi:hypothetical protein OFM87_32285, partial [Escherichia coli]|nr:hypothetical protein [Escherichia coli]
ALSMLAQSLIQKRGHIGETEQQRFIDAGFSHEQVLEVIAVVAASAITNYTCSVTRPELEPPFDAFIWHAPDA